MTTLFTKNDYDALAAIVFRPEYPGNATARGVVEAPNGDGKLDAQKRYAHVAVKYLRQMGDAGMTWGQQIRLMGFLDRAHDEAVRVARHSGLIPEAYMPSYEHGALRVLEYPVGVGGEPHTDFDLFTLNLYRDVSNPGLPPDLVHMGEIGELVGCGPATPHRVDPLPTPQHSIVYFAIPDHAAVLPTGVTVGEWIAERIARSRVVAK